MNLMELIFSAMLLWPLLAGLLYFDQEACLAFNVSIDRYTRELP